MSGPEGCTFNVAARIFAEQTQTEEGFTLDKCLALADSQGSGEWMGIPLISSYCKPDVKIDRDKCGAIVTALRNPMAALTSGPKELARTTGLSVDSVRTIWGNRGGKDSIQRSAFLGKQLVELLGKVDCIFCNSLDPLKRIDKILSELQKSGPAARGVVPYLALSLKRDNCPFREEISVTLAKIGTPEAIKAIVTYSKLNKFECNSLLVDLINPEAVEALLPLLKSDTVFADDVEIRDAIKRLAQPSQLPMIVAALSNSKSDYDQLLLVHIIGKFGSGKHAAGPHEPF